MPAKETAVQKPASAEAQLKSFIGKFDPKGQTLIRAIRKALRQRLPTANELVYDNYNFFVIGYGPSERPSECILSMYAGASGVGLCFLYGATLPDPKKILRGSGNQNRSIRLEAADVFKRPAGETRIQAALAQSKPRMPANGRGKLIIRSVSAKQRPRRKVA